MKLTKKNLRSLVKEMVKVNQGIIKESAAQKLSPLRQMILKEIKAMSESGMMVEGDNLKAMMDSVKKYAQSLGGTLTGTQEMVSVNGSFKSVNVVGFADVKWNQSKGTRMSVNVVNTTARGLDEKTKSFLDQFLGAIIVDKTIDSGTYTIMSAKKGISNVSSQYGDRDIVIQKIEVVVPQGINLYINGKPAQK